MVPHEQLEALIISDRSHRLLASDSMYAVGQESIASAIIDNTADSDRGAFDRIFYYV